MTNRTKLETNIRYLVACNILEKPLSSLYQKAKKLKFPYAEESASLIREGISAERVIATIDTKEEEIRSRSMRAAVNEFKTEHPRLGEKLERMIQEKRASKSEVLVYAIEPDFNLGTEDYVRVMKDLGFSRELANATYPHLKEISDNIERAKKKNKHLSHIEHLERKILLE